VYGVGPLDTVVGAGRGTLVGDEGLIGAGRTLQPLAIRLPVAAANTSKNRRRVRGNGPTVRSDCADKVSPPQGDLHCNLIQARQLYRSRKISPVTDWREYARPEV